MPIIDLSIKHNMFIINSLGLTGFFNKDELQIVTIDFLSIKPVRSCRFMVFI